MNLQSRRKPWHDSKVKVEVDLYNEAQKSRSRYPLVELLDDRQPRDSRDYREDGWRGNLGVMQSFSRPHDGS